MCHAELVSASVDYLSIETLQKISDFPALENGKGVIFLKSSQIKISRQNVLINFQNWYWEAELRQEIQKLIKSFIPGSAWDGDWKLRFLFENEIPAGDG